MHGNYAWGQHVISNNAIDVYEHGSDVPTYMISLGVLKGIVQILWKKFRRVQKRVANACRNPLWDLQSSWWLKAVDKWLVKKKSNAIRTEYIAVWHQQEKKLELS
jgi:hypothetical protein